MAAGVKERLWDFNNVIRLLEEYRAEGRRIERTHNQFGGASRGG